MHQKIDVGKVGSNDESRRNHRDGGVGNWSSEVQQRLGEAEEWLWHLRAEIIGWKEKIDSLIKKVDGRLSLIMGLGQVLVDCKDSNKTKGVIHGPVIKEMGVKLESGPSNVSASWRPKQIRRFQKPKSPEQVVVAQPKHRLAPMDATIPQQMANLQVAVQH